MSIIWYNSTYNGQISYFLRPLELVFKHDSLWMKHIALCATITPTMNEGENRQGALLTDHISDGSLLTLARTVNTNVAHCAHHPWSTINNGQKSTCTVHTTLCVLLISAKRTTKHRHRATAEYKGICGPTFCWIFCTGLHEVLADVSAAAYRR